MEPIGPQQPPLSSNVARRAIDAQRLNEQRAAQRLTTSERLRKAAEDPADLVTSENLREVRTALNQEARRLERTNVRAAVADAALGEITDRLIETEVLAAASAIESNVAREEQESQNVEPDAVERDVERIASSATFAGESLLDGTATLEAAGKTVAIEAVSLPPLPDDPETRQQAVATARDDVTDLRTRLGVFTRDTVERRLETVAADAASLTSPESAVRNANDAQEAANVARVEILATSSESAAALANSASKDVLRLLG
ncbi:MAG: hypothetical protein HKO59_17675 [Phycisphaerales bacterium]|nr:hypothetical protein [Phycisphaerales bacterium]